MLKVWKKFEFEKSRGKYIRECLGIPCVDPGPLWLRDPCEESAGVEGSRGEGGVKDGWARWPRVSVGAAAVAAARKTWKSWRRSKTTPTEAPASAEEVSGLRGGVGPDRRGRSVRSPSDFGVSTAAWWWEKRFGGVSFGIENYWLVRRI
jgi:hypothetical protein